MIDVPEVVRNKAAAAGATGWLRDLPELVAALEREWSITVGEPYTGGTEAYVEQPDQAALALGAHGRAPPGGRDVAVSTKPIAPDLWTHIAITRDPNLREQLYHARSAAHAYQVLHADDAEDFNYYLEDVMAPSAAKP